MIRRLIEFFSERIDKARYGEQNRERNMVLQGLPIGLRRLRSEEAQTAVITTSPPLGGPWKWGIDIAGVWDGIIKALTFKTYGGSFVIVKGADGTLTGKYLYENVAELKTQGVPFALYFWIYPNSKISCKAQAAAWAAIAIKLNKPTCFVDYEWTMYGGIAANPEKGDLRIAIDEFKRLTGLTLGVYTSLGYVSEHPLDSTFAECLFWAAQYGVAMPSAVFPWGNGWTTWQQSDRWGSTPPPKASEWGINPDSAHVSDGDVMTPENFHIIYGGSTPPPPPLPPPADAITYPYTGVTVTQGRRFESEFQMIEIAPAFIAEAHITPPGSANRVEDIPGDIVVNGGDFNMTTYQAVGLLRALGIEFSPQADSEPALGFADDHTPAIDHHTGAWKNAVGVKRYLVVNGNISPNTSEAWIPREPRNIFGVKADGTLLLLQVKGRTLDNLGHSLFDSANVMIEFGAVVAGDGDGGDSVQGKVNDQIFLGTPNRRLVADFVSITMESGGNMTQVIQGTVLVDTLNIRTAPGAAGTTFNPPRYLHKGDKIEASENSNQWLHLSKINGVPVTDTEWASSGTAQNYITWGWVDVPVTPPPPPPPPPVEEDSMVCTIDFLTNAVHVERNQNGTVFTGDVTLVQK